MSAIPGTGLRLGGVLVSLQAALALWLSGAPVTLSGEFSPDGKHVAVTWPGSAPDSSDLALVDAASGPVRVVGQGATGLGSAWSPDGNLIAFQANEAGEAVTSLYDTRTDRARRLSRRMGPPYAWREDSRRLGGVSYSEEKGAEAVGYSVTERGETWRAATGVEKVDALTWLPDTDDVAFIGTVGGKADVYTVEGGQVHRISSSGDVLALQCVRARNELVWARSSKNTRYILLTLYAFDLSARSVRRMGFPSRVAGINPAPTSSPVAVDRVVVSPPGDRIAVVVSYAPRTEPRTKRALRDRRLFAVRTDGSAAKLVRVGTRAATGEAHQVWLPFWSTDGAALGLLRVEDGLVAVTTYAADGSGGRALAQATIGR